MQADGWNAEASKTADENWHDSRSLPAPMLLRRTASAPIGAVFEMCVPPQGMMLRSEHFSTRKSTMSRS